VLARSAGTTSAPSAAAAAPGNGMVTILGNKQRDLTVDVLAVAFVAVDGRISFFHAADHLKLRSTVLADIFINRHKYFPILISKQFYPIVGFRSIVKMR
jgi:hypothetical protein